MDDIFQEQEQENLSGNDIFECPRYEEELKTEARVSVPTDDTTDLCFK